MIAPCTKRAHERDYGGSKIVVVGKPGCFAKGTRVMRYDGTLVNVEDVRLADTLMGDDSTPRNVMDLCQNREMMYRISPEKGDAYVVNEHHILSLKCRHEILDITVRDFMAKPTTFQERYNWYRVGVDFEEQAVGVDPYLFARGLDTGGIPHAYKVNSRGSRMGLLAGLIDSAGRYDSVGECVEIVLKSAMLLDDVVFVARSLGFSAWTTESGACQIRGSGVSEIPCKVVEVVGSSSEEDVLVSGFTVDRVGVDEYYGFVLDGNHRFLGHDFSVLHNTGKSTLIASLIYAKKHIIPVGVFMNGSEDLNHFYKGFVPSSFVFNDYDPERVAELVRRQKIAKEYLPNPWAVLLLDDCTDDPKIFSTPLQQGLFKRGRQMKLWYILSLQYAMDVKPVIRTNVDGVFILREPILKNRRALWENYASIIPDFDIFCELMDQVTGDHTALYIHQMTQTNTWTDCVFWYRAPEQLPKGFMFGSEDYKMFDKARLNTEYTETF